MSFVFQDITLFNDTVWNNIKIGNLNATDEQVLEAAKAACCDEFVKRLPDSYNTLLGENGSTLSGGERQRISIARALLKDAPIILLDAATAFADAENEHLIQRALDELLRGKRTSGIPGSHLSGQRKTVLMIAHRLSIVIHADQICVMERGRIVERGTHDELLKLNGRYAHMFHEYQNSISWRIGGKKDA